MLAMIDPLYTLSGLAVGVIVGLTGVGGGSLMTPLLILLFNVHPATAVGTDLLFAASTKVAGTAVHGFNRSVDWGVVLRLACGSVPGALVTVWMLSMNDIDNPQASHLITVTLGVMLLVTAITIALRKQLMALVSRGPEMNDRRKTAVTVLFGAAIGVLVSISSIGAGAVGVTVLMLIYPRMPVLRIVATDIAHAVPLTLVAGMGHWAIGSIDWAMLLSLLVGSIPGILIASHLSLRVPEVAIRVLLSTILTIVGLRLILS